MDLPPLEIGRWTENADAVKLGDSTDDMCTRKKSDSVVFIVTSDIVFL